MQPSEFLNTPVNYIMCPGGLKGDLFGLELELEGQNVALRDVATRGWARHKDGSLRGESIEYTTTGPVPFDELVKRVNLLFKKFKENNVVLNDSIRTSTHVHLNFCDKPVKQAINFFLLFTMLEELLQYYSGEDRKGNVFCISSREASGILDVLTRSVQGGEFGVFANDRFKYAACNLSALWKFGSVEVRTMRGAKTAEQVNTWAAILNDMYNYCMNKMSSPVELVSNLSMLGALEFLRQIFTPENLKELLSTFPAAHDLHYSLMEGARLIQLFAFEFHDNFLEKVEIPKDNPINGSLPVFIPHGPHAGEWYSIWRPDGRPWVCCPQGREKRWLDGMRVEDEPRIVWSAKHERFIVRYPDGVEVLCRWKRHDKIRDEGPPAHHMKMPPDMADFDHDEEEDVEGMEDDG